MTRGRSTANLANTAWEALYRAQATVARDMAADEAWKEATPSEYGVLYALSAAPEGMRISDLGQDVLLSQPGMSRLVSRLEARGLVQRVADPSDARACRIQLTPAGVAAQRRVGRAHARQIRQRMTRSLGRAELAELERLCRKLVA